MKRRAFSFVHGALRGAISLAFCVALASCQTTEPEARSSGPAGRIVGDLVPPTVAKIGASRDVPYDTTTVAIAWSVTDNDGLQRVTIGGSFNPALRDSAIVGKNGIYRLGGEYSPYRGELAVGVNLFWLTAIDSSGNVTRDTLRIRRFDPSHPILTRASGTASRVVGSDEASVVQVGWTVGPNWGVQRVEINGVQVGTQAGSYGKTLDLKLGDNPVRIVAFDAAGTIASDSINVSKASYPMLNQGRNLPGSYSRTVPFDTASVLVGYQVKTLFRDRDTGFTICGQKFTGYDTAYIGYTPFWASMPLVVGRNVARIQWYDTLGRRFRDSVVVVRSPDVVPPSIARVSNTFTTTSGVTTVSSSWTVSDNHKIASVKIQGVEVAPVGGVYARTYQVASGDSWSRIVAIDSFGNVARDSVPTREPDTKAPVVAKVAGAADRTLGDDSTQAWVAWSVSDDRKLAKVTINGSVVTGASGVYGTVLQLPLGGSSKAKLVAVDEWGNTTIDSIVVFRQHAKGPTLWLSQMAPTVVVDGTSSLSMTWWASDEKGVASVVVNGRRFTVNPDSLMRGRPLFNGSVALAYGQNTIVAVATDSSGNVTRDTLRVVRPDQTRPVVVRGAGTTSGTSDVPLASQVVSWSVSDNHKLASVKINGVLVVGASGIYSTSVLFAPGQNRIVIEAADSTGNIKKDSVFVTVGSLPAIAAGGDFGTYVDATGKVYAWGAITAPADLGAVVAVAAADRFAVGLKNDGTVRVWDASGVANPAVPTGLAGVVKIFADASSAAAIKIDGSVVVWGGLAGISASQPAGLKAISIAMGTTFVVAMKPDSTVVAWGSGAGATVPAGLGKVKSISASRGQVVAIRVDGTMVVWGSHSVYSPYVAQPTGLVGLKAGSAGIFHSIVLKDNGQMLAWGFDNWKQGEVPAGAPTDVVAISAGYRYNLALRANGKVFAWGDKTYGQLAMPAAIASIP